MANENENHMNVQIPEKDAIILLPQKNLRGRKYYL
jgi:hypothetical protein